MINLNDKEGMRFSINLLEDGSVITIDGEYIGTWSTDDLTDAFYQFTPEGTSNPLFTNPFVGFLCKEIEDWHNNK